MEVFLWTFVAFSVVLNRVTGSHVPENSGVCFPRGFAFGVATASYQIEGAWNISGKGESIWDRYTHAHPERVFDHNNGDVAADSYHQWREDVALLKHLGVSFYRFSISWSRILPSGFSNEVNEDGIKYYAELISALESNNIAPVVTMYHWDLPQPLQDLGGWTNPIMADYFVDYATVLFDRFSSSVKMWITFNEPLSFCHDGYGGDDAPGGRSSGIETYMCGHNVLRAHGKVYKLYQDRKKQNKAPGWIGITLDMPWMEPATTAREDQEAAEIARQFIFGWFAHPIFSKEGDYPEIMRKRIDEKSRVQNFARSRLPHFTANEVRSIKGSFDFLGLNHYTTYLASPAESHSPGKEPTFEDDMGVRITQKENWPKSNSTWLRIVPWGFRRALNWIKTSYNNPPTLVTENGISLAPGTHDPKRINYIDSYLRALHDAILKDKCHVIGYTYWSLIDNFEWMRGFSERFGLYQVDYTSPKRTRTARLSASYFGQVANTLCLPENYVEYTVTN
ncbi:myrosinase 1-like [Plodia interpunctella]|uniref:myrosinase 1-like n=1 Tax=Plodia interpunctella TaxID=58824 RepID=UPI002367CC96|nr:myrosinase 1-like [Plodia interpunctella]